MPKAARHLLEGALRTSKHEDQLTEVLGVALQEHELFRALFLTSVGFSQEIAAPEASVEIRTQRPTGTGRLVDLEVVVRLGSAPVARLWCENKLWADYQPNQLEDYYASLVGMAASEHRLITIVPAERARDVRTDVRHLDLRIPVCTWHDVGALAERAGRQADRTNGPDRAAGSWRHRPSTARQRALTELLWLLQQREGVMTTELRAEHAVALASYGEAEKIALDLCDQSIARSNGFGRSGDQGGQKRGTWEWYRLEPGPQTGPWAELGGYPELYRDQWDKFVHEPSGAATIFAGMTVPREHADFLTGEACAEWRATVDKEGFSVAAREDDDRVRVFAPLYLLELAARYSSFDAQVDAVARHIDTSLKFLLEEAPPPSRGSAAPPLNG